MTENEFAAEIVAVQQLPYGEARTVAAESLVRRIEAEGADGVLAWALTDLVEAYTFDGRGDRAFVAFARMLRLWDERPELFDEDDTRNLFWEYKWIADGVCEFPQVSRAQADEFLADMERRFRLAGKGLSAVHVSRFNWAYLTGDPDAEERRIAWRTTPSDEFEDCPACVIGTQVVFLLDKGRYAEALELGRTQQFECNVEPAKTRHAMALASLLTGDAEAALGYHRAALASQDSDTSRLGPARGQSFEVLARGDQVERALRALRGEDVGLLTKGPSPLDRLRFLLGVLAGLSANLDRGEVATGLGGEGQGTVVGLHAWVLAEARALAEAFDARNGNAHYRERVAAALRAERSAEGLDFSVVGALDEATADAEDGSGPGWVLAEAAQSALVAGDEDQAHELFGAAASRLLADSPAHGLTLQVLRAWAPLAARMNDLAEIVEALVAWREQLEAWSPEERDVPELAVRHAAERAFALAYARDLLARCLASSPVGHLFDATAELSPVDEATAAAEEFLALDRPVETAHAYWLAARLRRDAGESVAAIDAYERALQDGRFGRDKASRVEAAGELIALFRACALPEQAERLAASLTA